MKLLKIFPHISFILAGMFTVLWIIDRINSAMEFLDNEISNGMLIAFCVATLITSVISIYYQSGQNNT